MNSDAYYQPPESPYSDDEYEVAWRQIVDDRLYMGWDIEDAEREADQMAEDRCRVNREEAEADHADWLIKFRKENGDD